MISDPNPLAVSAPPAPGAHSPSGILFFVPVSEQKKLVDLPDDVRDDVREVLAIIRQAHADAAARRCSVQASLRAACARHCGRRGFSLESLSRKYYLYINGGTVTSPSGSAVTFAPGDWRSVVDRARAGSKFWTMDTPVGLPDLFLDFWRALCERNQRKNAPAWRNLKRIWATGRDLAGNVYRSIPGYPDWKPRGEDLPAGCSYANLSRTRNAPKKIELEAARHGREGTAKYRRKVFTTRKGLAVGQYILFDDQEYDVKVNWPGARQAMKPLGLNALDLYSACCISVGFKPTLLDLEGCKQKLRERDMLWLVADVLCNKGFRPDDRGTTLIVEHGTAAIRGDFEARIADATEGKVRVERSGISNKHLAGLFEGASKGNPRFKAALESLFNLVRNEMAMLPGATGMDRDHAPTEAAGLNRYNERLLKYAAQLPPELAAQIKFPVLTWEAFTQFALDMYHAINTRTDHNLEAWEKCGLVTQSFSIQLGDARTELSERDWLALSPAQQQGLQPLVTAKARKLSPQEVWKAGATGLQTLGDHALPILLGAEFGEEKTVQGGYITIQNRDLGPHPLRFPAELPEAPLHDGEKFLTYLNPHAPDRLILTDAKGRYVGSLPIDNAPARDDGPGVRRALGAARRDEARRLAGVTARAVPIARRNLEMHRHNAAIMHGQPVTQEELQAADALRARIKKHGAGALAEVLSPSVHEPAPGHDAGGAAPAGQDPNQSIQDAIDEVL